MTRLFYPADVATIIFLTLLAGLAAAFPARVPMWPAVVATSAAIIAALSAIAVADARIDTRVSRFLHGWAFAGFAYAIYAEVHWVAGPIHGAWVADDALIAIDRALFGGNPIDTLGALARPWLTEAAQIAYTLFYPLVVTVGAELYLRRPGAEFHRYSFACAFVFLSSYAGYILVPAVGPRFTLYDFAAIDRELPGLLLTQPLRHFVDAGGLVPQGVPAAVAQSLAHRDVFPSGHTMMTLVSIWWSWKMRLAVRWPVTLVGAVLVFGTVYLRYHYVVDVIAGAVLAAAAVWALPAAWRCTVGWLALKPTCAAVEPTASATGTPARGRRASP